MGFNETTDSDPHTGDWSKTYGRKENNNKMKINLQDKENFYWGKLWTAKILLPNALNYSKKNNTISSSVIYVYIINLNTPRHCNSHSNSQCSNKVSAHRQQHLTSAFYRALGTKNVVLRKTYSLLIASRQQHISSAVQRTLGTNNVVLRETFSLLIASPQQHLSNLVQRALGTNNVFLRKTNSLLLFF